MSFFAAALVLLSVVVLADADCVYTGSNAVLSSGSSSVGVGSTGTFTCLPGWLYDGSGSTTSSTGICYSGSTVSGSCNILNPNFCPASINDNFIYTTTMSTGKFSRALSTSVYLICKGHNVKGNGTAIQVTCTSDASGSGVWVSTDWCSGALGVSANLALLALAALAGLLYKRLF
jgi:hypothetical protein